MLKSAVKDLMFGAKALCQRELIMSRSSVRQLCKTYFKAWHVKNLGGGGGGGGGWLVPSQVSSISKCEFKNESKYFLRGKYINALKLYITSLCVLFSQKRVRNLWIVFLKYFQVCVLVCQLESHHHPGEKFVYIKVLFSFLWKIESCMQRLFVLFSIYLAWLIFIKN